MEKILADLQPTLTPVDFDPFAGGEVLLTAPATESQKEIWLSVQMGDDANCAFNESPSLRLRGQLDMKALRSSLQELVDRHEALRTTFSSDGSTLCIASSLVLDIPFVDLSNLSVCEQDIQLTAFLRQEVEQPFDLVRGPLFRVQIVRLQEREHLVIITAHHIVYDGWSWGVLLPELGTLYSALRQGIAADLKEPFRFSEYALLQAQQALSPEYTAAEEYWLGQFSDQIPVLDLPTDRPRPPLRSFNGASSNWKVNSSLVSELKRLGAQVGCSFMTILLAGFEVFLHRLSGQEDIVVGMPAAGQAIVGQYNLVGHCVNLLPLRTHIKGEQSFRDYLRTRRSTMLDIYEHQQITFGSLLKKLALSRESNRIPLISVVFNLDRALKSKDLQFNDLDVEFFSNPIHFINFEIYLDACESSDGLDLTCKYNTDLFDAQTICRRLEEFEVLLAGIVAAPDQLISKLPILPETEQQLLNDWNATDVAYPETSLIHEMFEKQVERSPDAIAVVFEDKQLTYVQLNQRANRVAHHLKTLGVGPEVLVGVYVERSLEMVVGLLGILKAGGAYVPLDPVYPSERITYILEDSSVPILLTQQKLVASLPESETQIVFLDTYESVISPQSSENPDSGASASNLACMIYTSGSTGTPKGVLIPHSGLLNLTFWHQRANDVTSSDRATQLAGTAFDASVWQLYPYLAVGASIYLVEQEVILSPEKLRDWLLSKEITITYVPTPLAEKLLSVQWPQDGALRIMLTGGDKLHQYPSASIPFKLVNNYGPTENTLVTTSGLVLRDGTDNTSPHIGRPIDNTLLYILDRHLQPLPVGIPGELHIASVGLARGYLNRPDLTQEKFISNPWSNEPGSRLFKTGDLARYLPDGNIEYLGRIDDQVKIRGFRIELGEIEAAITLYPAVRETVVVVREDIPGDKRLVAYIVPIQVPPTCHELRYFLQQKLPGYMVPSAIVVLSAMPLTPNGKVDRCALPAPDGSPSDSTSFVPPRDTVEQQLQRIWSGVLQLSTVGVGDNFFELGGHSLLAVRLMAQIQKQFGLNLPLATLLASPTIEQLASCLRASADSCGSSK